MWKYFFSYLNYFKLYQFGISEIKISIHTFILEIIANEEIE